jgi:hypothetical protein
LLSDRPLVTTVGTSPYVAHALGFDRQVARNPPDGEAPVWAALASSRNQMVGFHNSADGNHRAAEKSFRYDDPGLNHTMRGVIATGATLASPPYA